MYTLQKYKNYYNLCFCSLSWHSVFAFCPCIPSWHSFPAFCPGSLSRHFVLAFFPGIPSRYSVMADLQSAGSAPRHGIPARQQKMIVVTKRQVIDCQLSLTLPRTRRVLRNPAACAVIRFNILIVSVIADIVAQSDLEEMPAVSMSAFPFGSPGAILGHLDILGD